ncbi:putative leucine-rich repeat-containing protein DDB_G0290503 [Tetranychus urticae]|uniref:putative leucine-rich repeat-containing protein DDB_G0290503 n=1 Tax=Tetranychus urticae TaxID=32264 RepID=UPI00077B993D|nr:putative leucine-rich repeat-containing protein DDB_G0290503 [Tetranychus urticae]
MWNQPEEYFIEVVSNSSMEIFPENTLSKFSNKLSRPIDLVGEWVVGIQEIFYPTDISVTARTTSLQLLSSNSSKTMAVEFTLKATDDLNTVIKKINNAIKAAYASTASKKVKRDTLQAFHNLLATNVMQLSDQEKIHHLGEMMHKGSSAFTGLIARITKLTNQVEEKDKKINTLSEHVKLAEQHLKKLNDEKTSQKEVAKEFEKQKIDFQNSLTGYLEQINALKEKNLMLENNPLIQQLKEKIEKEKSASRDLENKIKDKNIELQNIQQQLKDITIKVIKDEQDSKIFWRRYLDKVKAKSQLSDEKMKELEAKLNNAKSDEEIANEFTRMKEKQDEEMDAYRKEREKEQEQFTKEKEEFQSKEKLCQQQLQQLKRTQETLDATIEKLKEDVKSKVPVEELNKLTSNLTEIIGEKSKIEAGYKELENVNATITNQLNQFKAQLTKEQELDLKAKKDNEKEIVKLKDAIEHEKANAAKLQQQINDKTKDVANLQIACSKTKVEYDSNLKEWNVHYEKRLQETVQEMQKLQSELQSLKSPEMKAKQEQRIISLKKEKDAEILAIKKEMDAAKQNFDREMMIFQDKEKEHQRQLKQFEADKKALTDTIERMNIELEMRLPMEQIQKLKTKLAEINHEKIAIESTNRTLQEKQLKLETQLANLKQEVEKQQSAREELVKEMHEVKQDLYKFKPQVNYDIEVDEEDQIPVIEIDSESIVKIRRGYSKKKILIPYFTDPAFLQSLGFDIYSFQSDIARLMTTDTCIKASKKAVFDLKAHLMFVYSDIVAEHFVGDKSSRVLRVLPIRQSDNNELVHERFMKPFYYPIRSNRIEQINFILSDETGDAVKFNSGRVLIGLHLKKVV